MKQVYVMTTKKLAIVLSFLVCLFVFEARALADDTNVYQKIISNIQKVQMEEADIATVDAWTAITLSKLDDDGGFPDLDYSSTVQTFWPALLHIDRMKPLALAYIMSESVYYEDENIYNTIVKMLERWNKEDPQSTNWYNFDIAGPDRMFTILCILRAGKKQIPEAVEAKVIELIDKVSWRPDNDSMSQGRAINKMDIALKWMYRSCLTEDKNLPSGKTDLTLSYVISQIYLPVKLSVTEGLQHDYSYLQHGLQLYIGFYGNAYVSAVSRTARYLEGTQYAATQTQIELIRNYLIKTYIPSVRGGYILYNALGRAAALKGELSRAMGYQNGDRLPELLKRMAVVDPEYKDTYETAVKRIMGEEPADYKVEPYNRHFWRGDYSLHQRPGYTVDVRMASTYTCRNENGNGENLQGYFLTDGASQVVIDGDEFDAIFPIWDWARIPGITAPALTSIPRPGIWEKYGQSRFTGGVSDELYGATTYHLQDLPNYASYNYNVNTEAKKAYFFFDKEIVYLGADIKSTNATQINTTINQCWLSGDVNYISNEGVTATLAANSSVTNKSLACIHHNKIAYYFPDSENAEITFSNKTQSGNWNTVSSNNGDATTITGNVFKAYFNHGVRPTNGTYAYVIVPNLDTVDEAKNYQATVDTNIEILENTAKIQAVANKELDILSAVFYEAGEFMYGDMLIRSSEPCVVMFRNISSAEIKVYVADPTRNSVSSLALVIKDHPILGSKELIRQLDTTTAYGGMTHESVIDANTLDYIHIPVEGVSLDKTELQLSYENLTGKLIANITPTNARIQNVTWSSSDENVVKVTPGGELIAYNQGEAMITVTTEDGGFQATCKVTINDAIKSSLAMADTYIYDGSASTNYGASDIIIIKKDNAAGYNRSGVFKFSIAALGEMENRSSSKVKVMLYTEYGDENVATVNWVLNPLANSAWLESTVTWNNLPTVTTDIIAQRKCILPESTEFKNANIAVFDITEYALAEYAKGNTVISFSVTQSGRADGGKGVSHFASKEHENELKHPRIMSLDGTVTALPEVEGNTLDVYPTITTGLLTISLDNPSLVQVFDFSGRIYQNISLPQGSTEINLSSYPAGMYLIKTEAAAKKIIKQ